MKANHLVTIAFRKDKKKCCKVRSLDLYSELEQMQERDGWRAFLEEFHLSNSTRSTLFFDKDGEILTETDKVKERCAEYYKELLNCNAEVQDWMKATLK